MRTRINRTKKEFSWLDFVGILSKESAKKLRESVEESRKSWDEDLRIIRKVNRRKRD